MKLFRVTLPDGQIVEKQSARPLTFVIAVHERGVPGRSRDPGWHAEWWTSVSHKDAEKKAAQARRHRPEFSEIVVLPVDVDTVSLSESKSKAEIEADFDRFEAEIEAREAAIKAFAEQHRDKVIGMPVLERFTQKPEFVVVHEDKDGWRISRFEGTLARPRAATGHTYRKDFETALHDAVRDYHGDLSRAEITENRGAMMESTMKSKKKKEDLRQLGADHAQEQLDSDYFQSWVIEQLSADVPEHITDARQIAKNMLQQLVWDTARDLRIEDVVGRSVTREEAKEFMDGFREQTKSKEVLDQLTKTVTEDWMGRDNDARVELIKNNRAGIPTPHVGEMREASRGLPRSDDYRNYTFFVSLWDFRDPSKGYAATLFNRRNQAVNSINGDSEESVREAAKKHWPGAREKRLTGRGMREETRAQRQNEQLYHLIALNRNNRWYDILTATPDTLHNVQTIKSKFAPGRDLLIVYADQDGKPILPAAAAGFQNNRMRESWQPGGTSIAMEDRSHLPRSQISLESYEREVLKRLRYLGVPNLTTRSTPIGEEARMLVLNGWRQGRKPFSTATEIERAWRESSHRPLQPEKQWRHRR